jgi:eukaryotic-like serine/threonine-protein kinase
MHRSPEDDCPVLGVTWYEAAEYCNWLSREEGVPENQWCYVPNTQGRYADGMALASDWLSRRGYRLPTEAEWEYASRAGTVTSYYFGESRELLGRYAHRGLYVQLRTGISGLCCAGGGGSARWGGVDE